MVCGNIFNTPSLSNHKKLSWIFEWRFTSPNLSRVTCHMSTCPSSLLVKTVQLYLIVVASFLALCFDAEDMMQKTNIRLPSDKQWLLNFPVLLVPVRNSLWTSRFFLFPWEFYYELLGTFGHVSGEISTFYRSFHSRCKHPKNLLLLYNEGFCDSEMF